GLGRVAGRRSDQRRRHEGARPDAALQVPLAQQVVVGARDRVAGQAELLGQPARGRDALAGRQPAGQDRGAELGVDLAVEGLVRRALEIDYVDESEVLTMADEKFHINKHLFKIPFVGGARDLGEALRRCGEGAAMIRTKGEAGTGDIVHAVKHLREVLDGIRRLTVLPEEELMTEAKNLGAPYDLVKQVAKEGRLPGVTFVA